MHYIRRKNREIVSENVWGEGKRKAQRDGN